MSNSKFFVRQLGSRTLIVIGINLSRLWNQTPTHSVLFSHIKCLVSVCSTIAWLCTHVVMLSPGRHHSTWLQYIWQRHIENSFAPCDLCDAQCTVMKSSISIGSEQWVRMSSLCSPYVNLDRVLHLSNGFRLVLCQTIGQGHLHKQVGDWAIGLAELVGLVGFVLSRELYIISCQEERDGQFTCYTNTVNPDHFLRVICFNDFRFSQYEYNSHCAWCRESTMKKKKTI